MSEEGTIPRPIRITIKPGAPVEIAEERHAGPMPTSDQAALTKAVGACFAEYRRAALSLLDGKYAHLKGQIPQHLREPGTVLCFCCRNGVVVRYDQKTHDEKKAMSGWLDGRLQELVPAVSGGMVFLPADPDTFDTGESGVTIGLRKIDQAGRSEEMLTVRLCIIVRSSAGPAEPSPSPAKPYCLTSIHNSFDFDLVGELMGKDDRPDLTGKPFVIRNRITLPVGWDCIEVYPSTNAEEWKPEYAYGWAENDILAALATRNLRDEQFRAVDPHADARRRFGQLLRTFKELLDSSPDEERVQKFLEANPHLLCPTYIGYWSKLPLGSNVTDFVYREASGDYLLVELESPGAKVFREDGQQREELTHAMDQVLNWRRYIEDNLGTVQRELRLDGISANPASLIVMGRSINLIDENRRKLAALQNLSPRLRILTYDDLLESAKSAIENMLGPIWETGPNTEVFYLPSLKALPRLDSEGSA